MIGLHAPFWLALLAVIPLIRWLHCFHRQCSAFPVTTLFLWKSFAQSVESDSSASRPDPRWLLRALIASLLVLALSEPYLQTEKGQPVQVWVDDSISLFTREGDQTRMQLAITQLLDHLRLAGPAQIRINSLSGTKTELLLQPENNSNWGSLITEWAALPGEEPSPPALSSLSMQSQHILLTDTADSLLNQWAQKAPLTKIIHSGEASHNIVLSRLSLRQPLDDSTSTSALLQINNLSINPDTVQLSLELQGVTLIQQAVDIPALQRILLSFTLPAAKEGRLHARIAAKDDSLSLDNELFLDLDQLYPSIFYQRMGDCGPYIKALLDSHPALIKVDRNPQFIIDCSGAANSFESPTLRLNPPRSIQQTSQPAHWHPNFKRDALRFPQGLPYSSNAPSLSSNNSPILSADGRMLILKAKGSPQTIDSYLDTHNTGFTQTPEFPLLIMTLIEQLSGQPLSHEPLTSTRDVNASRITPLGLDSSLSAPASTHSQHQSLVNPLLFTLLALLLLDAAIAAGIIHRPSTSVR